MEKISFPQALRPSPAASEYPAPSQVGAPDWRRQLPVLSGGTVTLRGLRVSDAPSLCAQLDNADVARFVSPPPRSVEAFEQFITWSQREQAAGRYACFAVVPAGTDTAVGIFQVRELAADFRTAEWGFVIGQPYWGSGLFVDGARLVIDFAVEVLGVHRLEARAAVLNGRGNGALAKLGAVREAVLRRSFDSHGTRLDQHLWSMLADDWRAAREPRRLSRVH